MPDDLDDLDEFLQEEDGDDWDRALRSLGSGGRDSGGHDSLEDGYDYALRVASGDFEHPPSIVSRRRAIRAPHIMKALGRSTGPSRKMIGLVVALILIAGLVVAQMLFSQTLTAPGTTTPVLAKNCDPVSPTPSSVLAGTNGFVVWRCTPTTGAIHVNGAGTVTPTITKGAEWTTTFIVGAGSTSPTTSCSAVSGPEKAIASGTAVSFVAADQGDWYYCSDFVNSPTIFSQITVSWSQ